MPPRTTTRAARTPRATKPETVDQPAAAMVPKSRRTWPVIAVLVTLLAIALSVAGYFYYQYKHTAQAADAKEIENLSQEIGKIMLLPEGETPTLATVTDKEKLADQPFFQKAENGDKVLIFSASGRAILYRPSEKKIIDVTTVNVNQPVQADPSAQAPAEAQPVPVPAAPAIVRVALRNGSQTVGVTNAAENQLKTIISNVAVTSKEDAKQKDYTKTIVVDLTGANTESVQKISQGLQGEVGSLPEGEIAPADADVLVIIGEAPAVPDTENQ